MLGFNTDCLNGTYIVLYFSVSILFILKRDIILLIVKETKNVRFS